MDIWKYACTHIYGGEFTGENCTCKQPPSTTLTKGRHLISKRFCTRILDSFLKNVLANNVAVFNQYIFLPQMMAPRGPGFIFKKKHPNSKTAGGFQLAAPAIVSVFFRCGWSRMTFDVFFQLDFKQTCQIQFFGFPKWEFKTPN